MGPLRLAIRTPQTLPLCDFHSLTRPGLLDESFAALPGDPGDPALLAAATTAQDYGPYPALRSDRPCCSPAPGPGRVCVRSSRRPPIRCRSLWSTADRTRHSQMSAVGRQDVGARALAEHGAWLATGPASADPDAAGRELSMLLSAARAALFAESLAEDREPELAVTVTAAVRRLGARFEDADPAAQAALEAYRTSRSAGRPRIARPSRRPESSCFGFPPTPGRDGARSCRRDGRGERHAPAALRHAGSRAAPGGSCPPPWGSRSSRPPSSITPAAPT